MPVSSLCSDFQHLLSIQAPVFRGIIGSALRHRSCDLSRSRRRKRRLLRWQQRRWNKVASGASDSEGSITHTMLWSYGKNRLPSSCFLYFPFRLIHVNTFLWFPASGQCSSRFISWLTPQPPPTWILKEFFLDQPVAFGLQSNNLEL